MRLLGLLGGMSWQSTAIYYRLLNEGARERLGGQHSAELLIWSFDFAQVTKLKSDSNWSELATLGIKAAQHLETAGAAALVICSNTMHKVAPNIQSALSIPIIHITDQTGRVITKTSSRRPLLLGTRYTMGEDFSRGILRERYGIDTLVPGERGRTLLHRVIYEELCQGIINEKSKEAIISECRVMRDQGADSVILGCTELTMILSEEDLDIPIFDTTKIHATSALDFALKDKTIK